MKQADKYDLILEKMKDNGILVSNTKKTGYFGYPQKVAYIKPNGEIHYFDKNLPVVIKKKIQRHANAIALSNTLLQSEKKKDEPVI